MLLRSLNNFSKERQKLKGTKEIQTKTGSPVPKSLNSSSGSRVLHLALQIPAVLSRIVLHLARRVRDPGPGIINPVRTKGVGPSEVLVNPRKSRRHHHPEPAKAQDPGCEDEEERTDRDPYRARYEEEWREEDEAEDGSGDGYTGEEEEHGSGDDEG